MEVNNKQIEIIQAMFNAEYYPATLDEKDAIEKCEKFPLSKLASLGGSFLLITQALQNIGQSSDVYKVIKPIGTHLADAKDGSGKLGALLGKDNKLAGQARLQETLKFDPMLLIVAAALMSIDKKLERILETQQEIIEFLELKEKSLVRGNLNFLTDITQKYKFNWNNEKFINSNHIKVLDIRQDSYQSILFYREKIETKVKKQSFIHSDKDVKDKLKIIQKEFKEYQLALYLYSFSSFLDVMLLGNFESEYLDSIVRKIEDYAYQYRELYTECYNRIEGYSKSTIQSFLLSGLTSINKAAGDAVAKMPVVSKSQIDETLIEASSRLGKLSSKRIKQTMEQLISKQSSAVYPFIENINTVNKLYNQPAILFFDKENIYLSSMAS